MKDKIMSSKLADYDNALECEGTLVMEDDWVILNIPENMHQKLVKQVEQIGLYIKANKKPHISVIKDEKPSINIEDWNMKKFNGQQIKFKISTKINHENGFHVWFDCYSPELCQIREHFGLPVLKKDDIYLVNFHTTVGKLIKPINPNLRKQYRLSKRTHIDVETLMQHI